MRKLIQNSLIVSIVLLLAFSLPLHAQDNTLHKTRLTDVHALKFFMQYSPNRAPKLSAHRGGPLPGFPENCIETFEKSLTYGPCLIECDVAMTADSVLIMMHDDTVNRTTNGTGKVTELTFAQIQELRLVDNDSVQTDFKIPTFGEVLDWAKENTILTVDVKRSVAHELVLKEIQEHEAEAAVVVITYNVHQATTCYNLNPELLLSVTIRNEEELQRLLEAGIPAQNMVAFVGVKSPGKKHFELLHNLGVQTILGTMGNLDKSAEKRGTKVYTKLFKDGADILSTDNVPLASQAIDEYVKKYLERND